MIPYFGSRRRFSDLSESEILALAISSEEDDARIYSSYAEQLREKFPASAGIFDQMAEEENGHRRLLIDSYERRFGKTIPLIRREHVAGYYWRRPIWQSGSARSPRRWNCRRFRRPRECGRPRGRSPPGSGGNARRHPPSAIHLSCRR